MEKNAHPDQPGNEFTFILENSSHLRQCLLPECTKKSIDLPNYFYSYFNLINEFNKFSLSQSFANLDEILNCQYLNINHVEERSFGLNKCRQMEKIVHKMLVSGYLFEDAEKIYNRLEHGIFLLDDDVEDNTIVRIRGLDFKT